MVVDRRMLVRTGLAVAALLAVSAATTAVAKGGAEQRRIEAVDGGLLGPAAPVGVRVPPVDVDGSVADDQSVEAPPVVITPATSPRTSVAAATTAPPPATAAASTAPPPPTPAPPAPSTSAGASPVATEPAEPVEPDASARPTRCLDLADVTAVRHDARTGVVRVEGTVGNCGSLDITFVVRVTDVSDHADPACGAGVRSTPVLVLGPASGDAWSVLTYPATCPGPYAFRLTAVDADGEQLALRSIAFEA